MSWAVAAILIARYLSRESAIAVVGIQTWVGALFLAPFALAQVGQVQHWDGRSAIAFAYLVIGGSCIGLVLNTWLYRHLRPTTVALSQILIPMQALLIGGLFLSEAFDIRMLAGAALVVGAVALNAKAWPLSPPVGGQSRFTFERGRAIVAAGAQEIRRWGGGPTNVHPFHREDRLRSRHGLLAQRPASRHGSRDRVRPRDPRPLLADPASLASAPRDTLPARARRPWAGI